MVEIKSFNSRLSNLRERFSKAFENFDKERESIKKKRICDELDSLVSKVENEYKKILNEEINVSCLDTFVRIGCLVGAKYLGNKNPEIAYAMAEASKEKQSYRDIRILVTSNTFQVVNISKISREKKISPIKVVKNFEEEGCKILKLSEFKKLVQEIKSAI